MGEYMHNVLLILLMLIDGVLVCSVGSYSSIVRTIFPFSCSLNNIKICP